MYRFCTSKLGLLKFSQNVIYIRSLVKISFKLYVLFESYRQSKRKCDKNGWKYAIATRKFSEPCTWTNMLKQLKIYPLLFPLPLESYFFGLENWPLSNSILKPVYLLHYCLDNVNKTFITNITSPTPRRCPQNFSLRYSSWSRKMSSS